MSENNNNEEEWRPTRLTNYEISSHGNCRKLLKNGIYKKINGCFQGSGKYKSGEKKPKGYKYIQKKIDKKRHNFYIHFLVAEAFIGERPQGMHIDHINRNRHDNHYTNLRYVTPRENCFNSSLVNSEVPMDLENRHNIIKKIWRDNNKEKVKGYRQKYRQQYLEKLNLL